jgi:histidyl-tRNA synthetase
MIKTRPISGFPDYTEAQNVALSRWLQRIEETYRVYGFSRLIPRPLELRSVLLSRGGIQKQVFGVSRLPTDNPTDLALPFDRTVPLANWVARNANDIVFPYKRYDISYSFRGERAQAGRFQGFFQADIDIIAQENLDLNADAECIAVIYEALNTLKLGDFVISLNHIGLVKSILREVGVPSDMNRAVLTVIDKIQKIGRDAAAREICDEIGLPAVLCDRVVEIFSYSGPIEEFAEACQVCTAGSQIALTDLSAVWSYLVSLGVPSQQLAFWPRNVRGLDYYSGVVFETFLNGQESIGSIASGGRYDDLVSTFSTLKLPGAGGSIGVTRLFDFACKNDLIDLCQKSEAQIFVGFRTLDLKTQAQELASLLRKQGLRVDLFSGTSKIKKQIAYADRKGIPLLIIPMECNSILIKEMQTGDQIEKPNIAETINYVLTLPINEYRRTLEVCSTCDTSDIELASYSV